MAAKLFKLRNVPDDEAEEIRQLLGQHEIAFYETPAGGWGVSVPAIWIHDGARLDEATRLVEGYQQERAIRAKADYQEMRAQGRQQTMLGKIRQQPVQFMVFLMFGVFIIYVTLAPFLHFGE